MSVSTPQPAPAPQGRYLAALSLGALGVVFGDIGTSPLYALRECFHGHYGIEPTHDNVLGVLSLIFWSLVLVVSIKYLVFVLRADNRGEGGLLALVALVAPQDSEKTSQRAVQLILLGLFGASLTVADGMLTPAISVLSAVEGVVVAAPGLEGLVIPATVGILVALFAVQRRGTGPIGAVFGPVMLLWFTTLAALGVFGIAREPAVLAALGPWYAVGFFVDHGMHAFIVLGAVFLVVTGCEALYADMGHFGRRPIRLAWAAVVAPGLVLNYFGQGALLLTQPGAAANPFFLLAPRIALIPLIALATAATVIASQALISGCFSLANQAIALGYSPRLAIQHTSERESGQIYVGFINWFLMLSACALVVGFGSSTRLAAAYGMAVSTVMVITTCLLGVVAHRRWGWTRGAIALVGLMLPLDLAFFGANLVKLPHGGWFTLLIGLGAFVLMSTWKRGRQILRVRLEEASLPLDLFLPDLGTSELPRVPGTAVFMTGDPQGTPLALLHNITHNQVVHQQTICLTLQTEGIPYVDGSERITVKALGEGFFRVVGRFGFMEIPDVPTLLRSLPKDKLAIDLERTSYFLGRERLIPSGHSGMARWREWIFARMSQNAQSATSFFGVPPDRVVELGVQVEL